jgi:hypothetical protein
MSDTPDYRATRALRLRGVRNFVKYHVQQHGKVPSKKQIDQHVTNDMQLAKVMPLNDDMIAEIWKLVYDHGVRGLGGEDGKRIEELCDEWEIEETSTAVRNRVRVCSNEESEWK